MTTKPTPRQRAVIDFWDDELPIQLLDEDPEEKSSLAWTLFRWAIGLIAVCLAASLMVPK
jgi:hypothetical protein